MALVLYLALVVAAYLIVRAYKLVSDNSARLPPPEGLPPCDGIERAYLEGGAAGALRFALRPMVAGGLVIIDGSTVARTSMAGGIPDDELEYAIYDALRAHGRSMTLSELERRCTAQLAAKLTKIVPLAEREELLLPSNVARRIAVVTAILALLVVTVGAGIAAYDARNGVSPYAYLAAAAIGLLALAFSWQVPRLSERGRQYLARQAGSGSGA